MLLMENHSARLLLDEDGQSADSVQPLGATFSRVCPSSRLHLLPFMSNNLGWMDSSSYKQQ